MGSEWLQAFTYYSDPDVEGYIAVFRWPFACLITLTSIAFLTWIFTWIFCCWNPSKGNQRNEGLLSFCTIISIIICFLIFALFIVIIIWIGFSEVSSRHSRCQFAIVTSFIVNGFYNPRNGNQYGGLVTIQK